LSTSFKTKMTCSFVSIINDYIGQMKNEQHSELQNIRERKYLKCKNKKTPLAENRTSEGKEKSCYLMFVIFIITSQITKSTK